MKNKYEWEIINQWELRKKVYGGWIYSCLRTAERTMFFGLWNKITDSISTVFIPDENHEWEIK
jgi:hypothetical protein